MGAVMLTVQKANTQAMAFYTKLRYVHYGLVWFED
jgi:N-alpha-acetyltransferase 40